MLKFHILAILLPLSLFIYLFISAAFLINSYELNIGIIIYILIKVNFMVIFWLDTYFRFHDFTYIINNRNTLDEKWRNKYILSLCQRMTLKSALSYLWKSNEYKTLVKTHKIAFYHLLPLNFSMKHIFSYKYFFEHFSHTHK